jgi:hypothetical protein
LENRSPLLRPAAAGAVYAISVFSVGFVLGTVRVLILLPRIGPTLAVLAETPVILGASWWVSSECIARLKIDRAVAARLVMGLVAFTVLMAAETTLAVVLFGRSVTGYLLSLTVMPGLIGLAAQVAFAGFPLAQLREPRHP